MANFRIANWNMDEFERIRKSDGLVAMFASKGAEWTRRLNDELHAAQESRNQPVENGYDYNVTTSGTRARLYVSATTARAMAHEARNQSMLKQMPIGGDVSDPNPVDPNLPSELARRSNQAQGSDVQGNPIHRLDS